VLVAQHHEVLRERRMEVLLETRQCEWAGLELARGRVGRVRRLDWMQRSAVVLRRAVLIARRRELVLVRFVAGERIEEG
jgi:hypothetical protein